MGRWYSIPENILSEPYTLPLTLQSTLQLSDAMNQYTWLLGI